MADKDSFIVVTGATGQQGGATARHLLARGFGVRALVRDVASPAAGALARAGATLAAGDMGDRASLDAAMRGARGVFSVQPSAGQPEHGVTAADEVRLGVNVADAAKAARVAHFVYTSVAGADCDSGIDYFDSKWQIERYVRALGVPATILRPSGFMEIFALPAFGIGSGVLSFFGAPSWPMQLIAVDDIGRFAALAFEAPGDFAGETLELAGDRLSGTQIVAAVGHALGRAIGYQRYPEEVVRRSPALERLVAFADRERGQADIPALRRWLPDLSTFDAWLEKTGKALFAPLFAPAARS